MSDITVGTVGIFTDSKGEKWSAKVEVVFINDRLLIDLDYPFGLVECDASQFEPLPEDKQPVPVLSEGETRRQLCEAILSSLPPLTPVDGMKLMTSAGLRVPLMRFSLTDFLTVLGGLDEMGEITIEETDTQITVMLKSTGRMARALTAENNQGPDALRSIGL
jgi:hypothetical protein